MRRELFLWIVVAFVAAMALTGCEKENKSKTVEFTLRGFVKTTDGQPILGIQVYSEGWIMTGGGWRRNFGGTLSTDRNGEVVLRIDCLDVVPDSMSIVISDVDGELNCGSFQSVAIHPEIVKTGESLGSWNVGRYQCMFDVALEKK